MLSIDGFVTLKNVRDARSALLATGYLLIEQSYSRPACDEIIGWIDSHADDEKVDKHYSGTEVRIWDSHKRFAALSEFWERCNVFMSCLLHSDTEAFRLLAIRNRAIDQGDNASQLGRWHLDSFRRQYKIFLFLSDVSESTGCFEFIQGTHSLAFKVRMVMKGIYFKPKDFLGRTRRYSCLDDAWVSRLTRPVPVLCQAGTIMIVDSSAIHRARPCLEGTRYALTAYYR